MASVYNLLREACGISQADAADFVHEVRLDTVKSWCSDRRQAPQWAINQLQSLSRRIRRAGEIFAGQIQQIPPEYSLQIGLPSDDDDARAHGFPSTSVALHAIAIAISLLPDDAEIRIETRARIPSLSMPKLESPMMSPTATDAEVLSEMNFSDEGRGGFYTAGAINRRKYERLEDIGWVTHFCPNISDVVYELTAAGMAQLEMMEVARLQRLDGPIASGDFQSQVRTQPRRRPAVKLSVGKEFKLQGHPPRFSIDKIEDNVVTARLSNGSAVRLYADPILL